MTSQRVIALLGRRDEPTDAVEDYCGYLGAALTSFGVQLELRRVPWNQHGWSSALEALRLQALSWRGTWVLVQYTALAWSARGFPQRFLKVLRLLAAAGARVAVVYHDAEPFGGTRLIERLRRTIQLRTMRSALGLSEHAVFTVLPKCLSWRPALHEKYSFIPVGANLPFPLDAQQHEELHSPPTIGVFSITGGTAGEGETLHIVAAVRRASQKLGALCLLVFGRHADLREAALREGLRGLPVELQVCGVLEDKELAQKFAASDLLLFVRGTISSRRSSAIAGIACGLPVIALKGRETASPITDAGVILLPEELDRKAVPAHLGDAIARVLSEKDLRADLVHRSLAAHEEFFAWPAIAARYAKFLNQSD
jgi:glycosyltransferase involved in cell wall biosynthesis